MPRTRHLLPLLMGAALALVLTACPGNGGSADSEDDIYTPAGTGGINNQFSGNGEISAIDILNYANSGNMQVVEERLSSGTTTVVDEELGTQTVSFRADDIGLPPGGKATLSITGSDYDYSDEEEAGSDGLVLFEIPLIPNGSILTITLTVTSASGTVLFTGSQEQDVSGASCSISVPLARQFWTLTPGTITAAASPSGLIFYAASWESDSTTLSVSGLDDAPSGASFTYEWKDETGAPVSTEASFSKTVKELYGSPASPPTSTDDLTKTFTVTVSYTDDSGDVKTDSASATVVVGGPVELPEFTIDIAPPSTGYYAAGSDTSATPPVYALSSLSAGITFTANPGAGSFPAGTTFEWTVNGQSFPAQTGQSCTVCPSDLSLTLDTAGTSTAHKTLSVSCKAKNDRAPADKDGTGSSVEIFMFTLPEFTIEVEMAASDYNADNSAAASHKYALTALGKSMKFTAKPADGESFPAGTTLKWEVKAGSLAAYKPTGATGTYVLNASMSSLNLTDSNISTNKDSPTAISIKCTATHPSAAADKEGTAASASVFLLTIPKFDIELTPPAGIPVNTKSGITSYIVSDDDLTKNLTLEAKPSSASDSFPTGTKFSWKFGSAEPTAAASSKTITKTIKLACGGISTAPALSTGYYVVCEASIGDELTRKDANSEKATPDPCIRLMSDTVPIGDLANYLASLANNTASTPYKLKITGLTSLADIRSASGTINSKGKFVDLSETVLPNIDSLMGAFSGCSKLVKAPAIPLGVTNLNNTFANCGNLTTVPNFPTTISNMSQTFMNCGSLTSVPAEIPDGAPNMDRTFYGCGKLTTAPVIPASVTTMDNCFYGCKSLTGNVVVKATNTSIPNFWSNTFGGGDSEPTSITVYVDKPSAKTSEEVKSRIISDSGNSHLTADKIKTVGTGGDFTSWP